MFDFDDILHSKLIPWARQNAHERFIVARPRMSVAEMPDSVRLIRHKVTGKRQVVKSHRHYHNTRSMVAVWPEIGLNEVGKLKLVCVLDGNIDYQLGDYRLQCGPGNFIFIPPGTPHPDGTQSYVDTEKNTFCDLLFFLLHPNAIECWISHFDEDGRISIDKCLILHECATLAFRILMEEVIGGDEKSFFSGEALLFAFLIILQREASAGRVQMMRQNYSSDHLDADTSSPDDFTKRLKHYVQANLHKTLTLELVARDMFLSRAQFTRIVRRETGKSFNEFLAFYRMEKAKELLRDSDWTISAIAAFVGFKSPSYFRTFFRSFTHETPSSFRDAHKRNSPHKKSSVF